MAFRPQRVKHLKELCEIKGLTTLSHMFILVKMFEFTVSPMVRGYYVYQEVWEGGVHW